MECLWLISSTAATSCDCLFYYEKQPPVRPACNTLNGINFTLHCKACASSSTSCSIGWYRNDSQPVRGLSHTVITSIVVTGNATQGNQIGCIESLLRFETLTFDSYGSYFCQVEKCSSSGIVHPSNRIHVEPSSSPIPLCVNDVITNDNHSCALSNCSTSASISPSLAQPLQHRQDSITSSSSMPNSSLGEAAGVALVSGGVTLAVLILVIGMFLFVMLLGWLGYRRYRMSKYFSLDISAIAISPCCYYLGIYPAVVKPRVTRIRQEMDSGSGLGTPSTRGTTADTNLG